MRKTSKSMKKEHLPVVSLNALKAPAGAHKKNKRKGRGAGSGHGKTSTRGSKGQTSRSGRDFYLGFEGGQTPLIRRIPKRGFTSKQGKIYQIVNIECISKLKDAQVTPALLFEKGIIKNMHTPVKILGNGTLAAAKVVRAHAFSKSAVEKIKSTGGSFEVIND